MASLSFDIEFGCGDPILTAQNLGSPTLKEDIEESIQKNLVLCPLGETCNKVAGVIITNVQDAVDFHRAEKQLPFQLKYTKSSGDDKITGSIVSIDIHGINGTHSRQTVSDLIKMLADPTERASIEQAMYSDMSARFGSNPLGSISDRSTCIMIHENTMDVQITEAVPTPAPRFMGSFDDNEKTNLHPETEGIYDCSCGTVMEINMGARFVSSVNLMKPVMHHNEMTINVKEFLKSTRNNLADYLKTEVPEAGVENCYINAVPIPVGQGSFRGNKGFTIRGPHKQEDGGKWTAKGFDYDYQFTVVVEGMNMNTGNDVFNALKKDDLADKLNVAMYGTNTRSNLMFGKDHATKWHTSGDITEGDVTVNGTKERWIPYFNETSFYKVQPSSIQLAFKEGNCEAIKAHIPHMEERPVIADCQYSGFGSAEWTAADKPCVNDGETAEQHRFQFVTELNQGPACTTENTALPICTVDLKANNIACRECSKQCAVDPAFYRESRQATGVKQCKNDCSAVIGEWMDGDLKDPSWGEVKACTQNGCDDWNEVTCRSPDGMKANCQQQVNTNKRVRSRKLTWGPQWNRYSAWKAMTEAERKIKDPNFDNCADWKVYPKKQTIACAVGQECAIDCVRSTHFSEGQCNGECTCPKDDSGNFLSNCNGKSGSADLTSNTMTYTFHIETPAAHKGKECKQTCPDHCRPESTDAECLDCLEMKVPCNQQLCPTICHMSPWSDWGSCSQTCGPNTPPGTRIAGAKQERVRSTVPSLEEAAFGGRSPKSCGAEVQTRLCALHPCGSHVCTDPNGGLPLTCTYDAASDIVYTHHVNDVHDNELFMCYHNHVTEVCTCLCWQKAGLAKAIGGSVKKHYSVAEHDQMITALHSDKYHASDATSFDKKTNTENLNKFLPDTAKSGDTFYNSDGQAVKMP